MHPERAPVRVTADRRSEAKRGVSSDTNLAARHRKKSAHLERSTCFDGHPTRQRQRWRLYFRFRVRRHSRHVSRNHPCDSRNHRSISRDLPDIGSLRRRVSLDAARVSRALSGVNRDGAAIYGERPDEARNLSGVYRDPPAVMELPLECHELPRGGRE